MAAARPNLDRMAAMGLRFENFFCTSPVCSPARQPLPGRSFVPWLTQPDLPQPAPVVVFDEYGPVRMIRSQTHKLVVRYPYGYHEFYDLEKDPNEEHNLIDDPAYGELILTYRRKLEKWFNSYANPDIDGSREGVTGSGQLCSAGLYAQKLVKYAETD